MSLTKLNTGPKTLAGKKRSAQNAIKTGVYSASLLPNESVSNYESMRDDMIGEYGAYDAIARTAIEEFAMTAVRKSRIIHAETQYLSCMMQTEDARKALAEKIHGSLSYSGSIPWWFLQNGECEEKKDAHVIKKALNQFKALKAVEEFPNSQTVELKYPDLHVVVMWFKKNNAELFWQVVSRETQQQVVTVALGVLEAKLKKDFAEHIEWAENEHRYECAIRVVHAELAMRIMSNPEMIKLTNSLNRQAEHALSMLHARDQLIEANQGGITVQAATDEGLIGAVSVEAPQGAQRAQVGAPSSESEPSVEQAQGVETANSPLNAPEPADPMQAHAPEGAPALRECEQSEVGEALKAVACASEPQVDSETASGDGQQKPDLKPEEQEMEQKISQ